MSKNTLINPNQSSAQNITVSEVAPKPVPAPPKDGIVVHNAADKSAVVVTPEEAAKALDPKKLGWE